MNTVLFNELEKRFKKDQEFCKNFGQEYIANCKRNSEWLENIVRSKGWFFAEEVGKQGELFAWLIVQHSPDLHFQEFCLSLLQELPYTEERKQHIAFLEDRVLVRNNKPQVYGTQFKGSEPFPIMKESKLDSRRKEMGLCPFKEYYTQMQN